MHHNKCWESWCVIDIGSQWQNISMHNLNKNTVWMAIDTMELGLQHLKQSASSKAWNEMWNGWTKTQNMGWTTTSTICQLELKFLTCLHCSNLQVLQQQTSIKVLAPNHLKGFASWELLALPSNQNSKILTFHLKHLSPIIRISVECSEVHKLPTYL
jgi:hypothetical protein